MLKVLPLPLLVLAVTLELRHDGVEGHWVVAMLQWLCLEREVGSKLEAAAAVVVVAAVIRGFLRRPGDQ